ncbi:MAG: LysR family transcriptional regulator [Bacteroidia bacterium]|nr:LysR family transcriptional regulator [Bacteroidia bacterium]
MKSKNKKYDISFRIWFYLGEDKFLGKGRIELLERIKRTGSITNAAKEMKMSYRQAWQMVQEMNERAKSPLVEKRLGGKTGGGAIVTDAGVKAIATFHKLENKVKSYVKKEFKKINI